MAMTPASKLTEIGDLPADWQVHELGDLGSFKNGINKGKEAFGHGSPFVNLMDVFGVSSISSADHLGLVKSSDDERRMYDLRRGDVLFIRSSVKPSGVGLTAVIEESLTDTVYSGFIIRFRDGGSIAQELKRHCFGECGFRARLISASSVSANTNINQNNLRRLCIGLPPAKVEQEAIAEALSDADALIESIEELVKKKRLIKQGAMQELLTGKKRLPGFESKPGTKQTEVGEIPVDWAPVPLGQLGHWKGGATPSMRNPAFWSGGTVPWLSSGDIKKPLLDDAPMKITELAVRESSTTVVPPGSIVVVMRSGILRKYFPVAITMASLAINQDLKALLPMPRWNSEYVLHVLVWSGPRILGSCLKAGTTVESVEFGWLRTFETPMPSLKGEQEAIAEVLSDMDAELDALDAKLTKARQIKQGMMHELLTGRIRLV